MFCASNGIQYDAIVAAVGLDDHEQSIFQSNIWLCMEQNTD